MFVTVFYDTIDHYIDAFDFDSPFEFSFKKTFITLDQHAKMSGTVIEMLINSLTFFFFDNFSRHKQWRMHKPDSSLLSNAGRYEAIFLFPLKIVRLDYFWDFIVLFTEKLKFHTNYRCKNCIKLKMHMLLVECVKPYNSFENRMKKCT